MRDVLEKRQVKQVGGVQNDTISAAAQGSHLSNRFGDHAKSEQWYGRKVKHTLADG